MRTFCLVLLAGLLAPLVAPARNPAEEKIEGAVVAVAQHRCKMCQCVEVTAVIKTDAGRVAVRLGPKAYLEQRDFTLLKGDLVAITGIRVETRGRRTVFLANEIHKGGDTLTLRGKFGRPEWLDRHGHTCPSCEL